MSIPWSSVELGSLGEWAGAAGTVLLGWAAIRVARASEERASADAAARDVAGVSFVESPSVFGLVVSVRNDTEFTIHDVEVFAEGPVFETLRKEIGPVQPGKSAEIVFKELPGRGVEAEIMVWFTGPRGDPWEKTKSHVPRDRGGWG